MRQLALLFCLLPACLFPAGCKSRVINVTIVNQGSAPVRNVEVGYPGGSYGISQLAAGKSHQYRIKPMAEAFMEIHYVDPSGSTRSQKGPRLHQDQEGSITVLINEKQASITQTLTH